MTAKTYNHNGLAEKCINISILKEGGDKFTNRPNDKGGATKYGISDMRDRVRDGMVKLADGTMKAVKDLTREDAVGIYTLDYYKPLHAEFLQNESLILELFDWGVTSGPQTAISKLQELLHVPADGDLGQVTSDKANNYKGDIVADYKAARIAFYNRIADRDVAAYKKSHPNATYSELVKNTDEGNRRGWINRVNNLKLT
jgi:lysozyme family protein